MGSAQLVTPYDWVTWANRLPGNSDSAEAGGEAAERD
jgi:hypothetical protein